MSRKFTIIIGIILTCIVVYLLGKYTDVYPEYRVLTDVEQEELTAQRIVAYNYAVACSKITTPELTFDEIVWALVPGDGLSIPTLEGKTVKLRGWFNPRDSTIYIPFTERETFWILAHESLHAIGYRNHPDIPFRTCRLMPDQNP
jgi:hypothetical protein